MLTLAEVSPARVAVRVCPDISAVSFRTLDDAGLITRVIQRETGAQDEFIRRFGPLIIAILRRSALPVEISAEDAYQQIFVHLWENDFRRLRLWQNTGRFSGYLAVIVQRVASSYRRNSETLFPIGPEVSLATPPPEQRLVREELRGMVRRGLECLAQRDRAILLRRYVEELSYREIAECLGMTTNHVGVALARAERRLAKQLRAMGYSD